jgi:hypothetical protein
VWPRPRPDTIGTATPQAATAGASGIEILSPTPAGRVLVDLGPGDRRQVEDVSRPHHGVGPGRQLTVVEPAEVDRHEHRRDLVVGEAAVGDAGDEAAQLGGGQRATVALGADQLDREARHQ